jgi:hypothetical protein
MRGWRERRAAREAEALRKGEILRQLHWQCWREDAPPLYGTPDTWSAATADLVEVLPVLIESGSVGLVWPRLWHRAEELAPAGGAVGAALQAAYESQEQHNARVERDVARVVTRLREHDVEPVLIKGFAIARLYPAPLVRPAGDIDLVVRDEDYAAAKAALAEFRIAFHQDYDSERAQRDARGDREPIEVDLHAFSAWGEASSEDFFDEATTVSIGGVTVRVPRVEDHLRALSLHFLRHAAVRPLRLCDIALLMEAGGAGGHRSRCEGRPSTVSQLLRGTAREAEQVAVTLGLAQRLLGAEPRNVPAEALREPIPAWLERAVLGQWAENPGVPGPVLPEILANPRGIVRTFTRRWPDPITATVRAGASFRSRSRLAVATTAYVRQIVDYATHRLARQAREQFSRGGRR